jgi:TPR repeat protein
MLKNQNAKNIFAMDDDTYKAAGYAAALESRRKTDEPAAAFFYGVYNTRICNGLQSVDKGQLSDGVKKCWLDSLASFKVASNAQIAAASFNIAKMYEGGSGVMPSKLVAADWYVKAADQYNREGARDEALTSVEAALNSVPDFPAALRLKQAMLK